MSKRDWERADAYSLGVFLNGREIPTKTPQGEDVVDDTFILLLNAWHEDMEFALPARRFGANWQLVLATADPDAPDAVYRARENVPVPQRSLLLLRRV
jgi:glycogen operon protein